jgi:hypothetical protein
MGMLGPLHVWQPDDFRSRHEAPKTGDSFLRNAGCMMHEEKTELICQFVVQKQQFSAQ